MEAEEKSLPASKADLWTRCGGWRKWNAGENPVHDRAAAEKGTAIHEFAESALRYWLQTPKPFLHTSIAEAVHFCATNLESPKSPNAPLLAEARQAAELYLAAIRNRATEPLDIAIEQPFKLQIGRHTVSGRADAILRASDAVYVIDLKTGMREVEAVGNRQLAVTAAALGLQNAIGLIVQPSLRQVSEAPIEPLDLEGVYESLRAGELTTGRHCRFCSYADVCPEFRGKMDAFLSPEFEDVKFSRPEVWAEILEHSKAVIKVLERVQSDALEHLKNGGEIPGYRLDYKNARRSWNHSMSAAALAKWLKLKRSQVEKTSLETPAQVEKFLESHRQKERFAEIVGQAVYPVLKRVGDNFGDE